MSGVASVWYLLKTNATLILSVPASRIRSGELPLKTTIPAISVMESDGISRKTVAMDSATEQWTETVDVTVYATTYPSQKNILALIQASLPLSRGSVNGIDVDSILMGTTGPDQYDSDTAIYSQTQKVTVVYNV